MKNLIILTIIFILISSVNYSQNNFQDFLDHVNSLSDSTDKQAAVDSFMNFARSQGIPFIEENYATFLYQGSANTVAVAGDFNSWNPIDIFTKIENTNLYYLTKEFELNARLDYKFVLNGNVWILDPENPKLIYGGFGPNSELAMPEYVQPWEINYFPNIPHGNVEAKTIYSEIVQRNYQLKIYLPPNYNPEAVKEYPVVYFQDGFEYIELASAINILDNLIDSSKIVPVIGVFVKPNDRNSEYAGGDRNSYRLFFASELVSYIDENYKSIKNADSRLVIGDSFGGNISLLISYNHPEVFGNCGLHSGAFWANNYEAYNLVVNGEKKDIKFASVWGSYESISSNLHKFKDNLITKGYDLLWMELPEGHSWGLWRATIDFILTYFFPYNSTSINEQRNTDPEGFNLYQNYPNPFNPGTKIKFETPSVTKNSISDEESSVKLKVYDILGNELTTLFEGKKPAGKYEVEFNTNYLNIQLSSGVYFYTLSVNGYIKSKKMLYLK